MSDFWWKRLSQNMQAYGRTSEWIMRWVASVDDRRNDLSQRVQWYGRSQRDLRTFADVVIDDVFPAAGTGADSTGMVGCWCSAGRTEDEYRGGDKEAKWEKARCEDDAATCSYGFQMRWSLHLTTTSSTWLVLHWPEAIFVTPGYTKCHRTPCFWRNYYNQLLKNSVPLI